TRWFVDGVLVSTTYDFLRQFPFDGTYLITLEIENSAFPGVVDIISTTVTVVAPPTNTPLPPPPATNTPVPPPPTIVAGVPTSTFTAIPPTATFTRIPPTATFTAIPPTATFTAIPPTATLVPTATNIP